MENNKHNNMGAAAEQQAPKRPLSLVEVVSESLEDWLKERKDKRAFILLGIAEQTDDPDPDARQLFVGMGGNMDGWVNTLMSAIERNRDLRNAVGNAIKYLAEKEIKRNQYGNKV